MRLTRSLVSGLLTRVPPLRPLITSYRHTAVPPFRPSLPRACRPRTPSKASDVDENAGGEQRDYLAGTAVGHERQGKPGSRDKPERHRHVHECRESNGCGKTDGEILPERVGCG